MSLFPAPDDWTSQRVDAIDGIRTGIGGWTYAPWRDNFYPKGLVQRRELEYASRHLSCSEINFPRMAVNPHRSTQKWICQRARVVSGVRMRALSGGAGLRAQRLPA